MRGTEVTLVLGPALVRYRDANGIQDVQITKGTLHRFTMRQRRHACWMRIGTWLKLFYRRLVRGLV